MVTIRHQLLVVLPVLAGAHRAVAQTKITFEEFSPGTAVRHQYAAQGVHFRGETIFTNTTPHSGKNVLYSVPPTEEVFAFPGPITMNFDSGQSSVRLFAGTAGTEAESATLTGFDAAGNVVMRDGPKNVTPGPFNTQLEVHAARPVIRRVELLYANDHDEVMDDLTFTGLPSGGLPTQPPTVAITSPKPSQQTSATTFLVEGTVTGPQVDPQAVLKVHVQRPPGSTTTADFTFPIDLVDRGSANVKFFTQTVSLGVGPNTIAMDAENSAGLHGKATVVIDALPEPIRARLRQEGGTAALGAFVFGSVTSIGECPYAVYARGAISSAGGTTFVVRGPILQKWLALQDPGKFPKLGCPRGEERSVGGTARAQDFASGRIYASPLGAFFVPPVFAAAIDVLGGEAGVGLPTSDPTSDSRPVFATWLFQRFARKGIPVASTLEIRGDPPKLFVERQGGDLSLFTDVVRANNPVIVESFGCASTAGPCSVAPPRDEPLFTGATALCHGKEFDWKQQVKSAATFHPDPPEWVPIRGNFIPVPIWGVLFDVHLAHGDNPFTHRNKFDPCPVPGLEALANELICPSDWDLKIRPLPGFRSMQPVHRDAVQIEFERVDFQHQLVAYGDPTPGDLIFAAGRFVVDCGHGGDHLDSFKTEIHPPSVYTAMKMVTRNGHPATQADTWVNWFFSGGNATADAVEFDIFPPPRPTPQAVIGASTPGDQNQAVKVTFKSLGPFGPMRVRVTATRRTPEVTKYGEMKPRKETVPFGFDGRLHVFWDCPAGTTCQ
ncbi:MAG TPA: hypothetical protein VHN14_28895 [Kofleriaceae bacterium]|jgi:hypothetical protein|nr:hypothetical protein [Kofleriaceae bacterium]